MLKPHITIFLSNGQTLRFYSHSVIDDSADILHFTYISDSDNGLKKMTLFKKDLVGISICAGHGL